VLTYLGTDANVVVVDGGPLFESASAEQLLRLVDCVVLVAPARRLRASTLEATARLIAGSADKVLPVLSHTSKWSFKRPSGRRRTNNERQPVQPTDPGSAALDDDIDVLTGLAV
jgi:hypothetical protein